MGWEEQGGNTGNYEQEDREFISVKIGVRFEGTFVRMSARKPSRYGGELRYVAVDLTDGRKVMITASKILLERLEAAGLVEGDQIRVSVEAAESKAGNEYALPRLYVNRRGGQAAPQPAQRPQAAPPAPPAPPVDDDDPGF